MSMSDEIPVRPNISLGVRAQPRATFGRPNFLYITSLTCNGTLIIDGISCAAVGPVELDSPIKCSNFCEHDVHEPHGHEHDGHDHDHHHYLWTDQAAPSRSRSP